MLLWLGKFHKLLFHYANDEGLFFGSYAFNWTWTGFKDHGNLWDWLSLLLVPVIVAGLPIWYSIRQNRSNSESIQHEIG